MFHFNSAIANSLLCPSAMQIATDRGLLSPSKKVCRQDGGDSDSSMELEPGVEYMTVTVVSLRSNVSFNVG